MGRGTRAKKGTTCSYKGLDLAEPHTSPCLFCLQFIIRIYIHSLYAALEIAVLVRSLSCSGFSSQPYASYKRQRHRMPLDGELTGLAIERNIKGRLGASGIEYALYTGRV